MLLLGGDLLAIIGLESPEWLDRHGVCVAARFGTRVVYVVCVFVSPMSSLNVSGIQDIF